MDIEVELALEVVRPELAEMCFIPCNNGREANLPHPSEEGEGCEDERCDEEFVTV